MELKKEKVKSIMVCPSNIKLNVGNWYYNAHACVSPSIAGCTEVEWYSSCPDVAMVNRKTGHVFAKSNGYTRIYANALDGSACSDFMVVEVISSSSYVQSIEMENKVLTLSEHTSRILPIKVLPERAANKKVKWMSSDVKVATVTDGVITAKNKGQAIITAKATDGSGIEAHCTLFVTTETLCRSITVEPFTKELSIGELFKLEATVYPENASNPKVEWKSSNESVATVCKECGVVVAKDVGSAVIYAEALDESGVKGYCTIKVNTGL